MWIGHRKEIRKLTFRALALRRGESMASSFINPVDKTKLSCNNPHRRSTTTSLQTYPAYSIIKYTDSILHFYRACFSHVF